MSAAARGAAASQGALRAQVGKATGLTAGIRFPKAAGSSSAERMYQEARERLRPVPPRVPQPVRPSPAELEYQQARERLRPVPPRAPRPVAPSQAEREYQQAHQNLRPTRTNPRPDLPEMIAGRGHDGRTRYLQPGDAYALPLRNKGRTLGTVFPTQPDDEHVDPQWTQQLSSRSRVRSVDPRTDQVLGTFRTNLNGRLHHAVYASAHADKHEFTVNVPLAPGLEKPPGAATHVLADGSTTMTIRVKGAPYARIVASNDYFQQAVHEMPSVPLVLLSCKAGALGGSAAASFTQHLPGLGTRPVFAGTHAVVLDADHTGSHLGVDAPGRFKQMNPQSRFR
ncbi:hypothetical protein [Actinocrispum wychmicini]|uniref:Uncharacterized protein n=1 Tax=Actinocrispum wychmicini TaxID=1213861 RepID=A0A4R2J9K3_9PSEU|nr:hypothetical protein [Actinocrispum wychmicini]TCO56011.1 hypothetical protein EV192_107436 [Actinocrispum wychmicini]